MRSGKLIVIEGVDGSGKTVQFEMLVRRLRRLGLRVATFDFPQYEKPSSYFVREYLNGHYGGWKQVGPYQASIFYALDRFDVVSQIKRWLKQGRIVVTNRYVPSNMAHQGAKIDSPASRRTYFKWLAELEYGILGIPKPSLVVVLHVPAVMARKLVDKKSRREYIGGAKFDLHEADLKHFRQAEKTYLEMVKLFPREFRLVECVEKGKLLSPEAVHVKVSSLVAKHL